MHLFFLQVVFLALIFCFSPYQVGNKNGAEELGQTRENRETLNQFKTVCANHTKTLASHLSQLASLKKGLAQQLQRLDRCQHRVRDQQKILADDVTESSAETNLEEANRLLDKIKPRAKSLERSWKILSRNRAALEEYFCDVGKLKKEISKQIDAVKSIQVEIAASPIRQRSQQTTIEDKLKILDSIIERFENDIATVGDESQKFTKEISRELPTIRNMLSLLDGSGAQIRKLNKQHEKYGKRPNNC